jgi:hypothetical protein
MVAVLWSNKRRAIMYKIGIQSVPNMADTNRAEYKLVPNVLYEAATSQ